MISFGPFLARSSGEPLACSELKNTGYHLEFASATQGLRIPIYRRKDSSDLAFNDYMFRAQDAPVALGGRPYDSIETQFGLFVRLEALLAAIYRDRQVTRPIVDFLTEFRESVPLKKTRLFPFPRTKPSAGLKPELTELGFYLADLFSYGRRITAFVIWYCPQDRKSPAKAPYFSAGAVEFHPRPDRTLDEGKWLEPMPGHLISPLREILRRACPGPPLNLLSDDGRKLLVDTFKWTPLSKMTNQQARKARIEFTRKHPELIQKPKELALALRQARLYAETTSLVNILDHLDSIIAAAAAHRAS